MPKEVDARVPGGELRQRRALPTFTENDQSRILGGRPQKGRDQHIVALAGMQPSDSAHKPCRRCQGEFGPQVRLRPVRRCRQPVRDQTRLARVVLQPFELRAVDADQAVEAGMVPCLVADMEGCDLDDGARCLRYRLAGRTKMSVADVDAGAGHQAVEFQALQKRCPEAVEGDLVGQQCGKRRAGAPRNVNLVA